MIAVFHTPFVSKYLGLTTPHLNQDWIKWGNRRMWQMHCSESQVLICTGCSTQRKANKRVRHLTPVARRLQEHFGLSQIASALGRKLTALSEVSCMKREERMMKLVLQLYHAHKSQKEKSSTRNPSSDTQRKITYFVNVHDTLCWDFLVPCKKRKMKL